MGFEFDAAGEEISRCAWTTFVDANGKRLRLEQIPPNTDPFLVAYMGRWKEYKAEGGQVLQGALEGVLAEHKDIAEGWGQVDILETEAEAIEERAEDRVT
jgi:hypothetical protein